MSSSSARRALDAAPAGGSPVGVAVLGSTGSIGRQTLEVIAGLGGTHSVIALAAGRRGRNLEAQAAAFHPRAVALDMDEGATLDLPRGCRRVGGPGALEELATRPDVDLVVVATGGIVSLRPVLAALTAGKVVAIANKETLVAGGHLVMPLARRAADGIAASRPADDGAVPLAWVRPIDSEHSAIWQCLVGEEMAGVASIVLTASGGPFRDLSAEELARVTPAQALRHPTWSMGEKITIDSATLANKGLEVVEAHWLYDLAYDAIEVLIHPQSVVHSAVRFTDGSMKAQLGTPDMRLPIQYALTYPNRRPSPASAPDLAEIRRLDFAAPDLGRFPALRVAREAGRTGSRATTALIAADEVAVARFLGGTLDFPGIPRVLEEGVRRFGEGADQAPPVDELVELDREVRGWAGVA